MCMGSVIACHGAWPIGDLSASADHGSGSFHRRITQPCSTRTSTHYFALPPSGCSLLSKCCSNDDLTQLLHLNGARGPNVFTVNIVPSPLVSRLSSLLCPRPLAAQQPTASRCRQQHVSKQQHSALECSLARTYSYQRKWPSMRAL